MTMMVDGTAGTEKGIADLRIEGSKIGSKIECLKIECLKIAAALETVTVTIAVFGVPEDVANLDLAGGFSERTLF